MHNIDGAGRTGISRPGSGKPPQAPKEAHDSYPFYHTASDNLDVNVDNHDPSNGCFALKYLLVERIEYRLKPLEISETM